MSEAAVALRSPAPSRARRAPALLLALAATLAVVLPVWTVAYPPLQDYPYHLVRAQILAEWSNPYFDYPSTFARDLFPTPYVLVDYLLAGLGALLGVPVAGKVVLSLTLALLPWSLYWLLTGIDRARAPLALLGVPLAYHWHFHMGFLNYSLSLPVALLAIGWWWRWRNRRGALATVVLAALVTGVYLLHLYTWGLLLVTLLAMAVVRRGRWRRLARIGVAYLPGSALLLALLARAPGEGEPHAWLLFYGSPLQRAELVVGSLLSYSLRWEGALLLGALLLAIPLLFAGRRRGAPMELAFALAALGLLFVALPDHVGEVYFISNRVPLLMVLLAIPLLALPAEPRRRRLVVVVLAVVALLQVAGMAWRYQRIDPRLSAYAEVLASAPAEARVGFRAHRPSMREGRIAPAAIFGGYHYLEAPGDRLPDLEHFVGFLRPVSYRHRQEETMSTAAVRSREQLASLLGRRHVAGPGGLLLTLLGTEEELDSIAEVAPEQSWRPLGTFGPIGVYLKERASARGAEVGPGATPEEAPSGATGEKTADDAWYATGYLEGVEYLAVYALPEVEPPEEAAALELLEERGPARLYWRRPTAAREPSRPATPALDADGRGALATFAGATGDAR